MVLRNLLRGLIQLAEYQWIETVWLVLLRRPVALS